MPSSSSAASNSRRSAKSRFGCTNCKIRHVKCDESTPCRNCVRRREKCSLDKSSNASTTLPITVDRDWAVEMHLMHHYTAYTAESLGGTALMRNLFKLEIPKMGRDHDFLCSAIVATAALHIAELQPNLYDMYALLYRKHQLRVLSQLQNGLQKITDQNCHALFGCCALVALFTVKELSMDSSHLKLDRQGECHRLGQSLKVIIGATHVIRQCPSSISAGPLQGLLDGHWVALPVDFCLSEDAKAAIERLRPVIQETCNGDKSSIATLNYSLKQLERLYLETAFLIITSGVKANHLIKWNAMVPWHYIELLSSGNDAALLIKVYCAILTVTVDVTFSLSPTYGAEMLRICRRVVSARYQHLLDWPEEQFANNFPALMTCRHVAVNGVTPTPSWKTVLEIPAVATPEYLT